MFTKSMKKIKTCIEHSMQFLPGIVLFPPILLCLFTLHQYEVYEDGVFFYFIVTLMLLL